MRRGERRLLRPEELWPQERQLCAKVADGGLLDLRSRPPGEDEPVQGWEWDRARWVRAPVLFQLLTGYGPPLAESVVAVRLRGAQVVGRLNVGGWKLRCPLELYQCYLGYRLDLAKTEAPNISLRGSYLRSRLSARLLHVVHTLNLVDFRCDGGVVLRGAHIGGLLNCDGAIFTNPNGEALNAERLTVDIDMSLFKARCTGETLLFGAHIGGLLICAEAVFTNPDGQALNADLLTADAGMLMRKARCTGKTSLTSAHIGGPLYCDEAVFSNPNDQALNAEGLTVDTDMSLSKAQCTGKTSLFGAHIGGLLNCDEAVFSNPDGQALRADLLTVDTVMLLRKARCTGKTSLFGAHIGGLLSCREAVFSNPNDQALNAERLTVDAGMLLRKARCTGETLLFGAHINGLLNCDEAVFSNPDGQALNADLLTADAGMLLSKAQCTGETSLAGAHIGGALYCDEAVFSNPNGEVAVQLEFACVTLEVRMRPAALDGDLDLRGANVGTWWDEKKTWPKRVLLEGFVYGSIKAPDATVKDRLRSWLPQVSYLPQPYEQLAGVYRREGDDRGARAVAIGKQRARRANVQGWSRWPSRVWSALLRWTIGYGYRPVLVLIPWFGLLGVGSLLFQFASHDRGLLHPAKAGSEQPGFNTFRYTVDLLLPVANFKQRDTVVTGGWATWASFGFIFAGWLLAAIVVAGLTGVFKRD